MRTISRTGRFNNDPHQILSADFRSAVALWCAMLMEIWERLRGEYEYQLWPNSPNIANEPVHRIAQQAST